MLIDKLFKQGLIHPPKWLPANTQYLVQMGSVAYGVSGESSDVDVYGWTIPPREDVFPHLAGEIEGFGRQKQHFGVWQEHHVKSQDGSKEYDFSVYSIVKFFHLCMENNPNMINALFVPRRCVLHSTAVSERLREKRKIFLHKGAWHKFRGYAFAQQAKIRSKANSANPKRAADMEEFGYSTKFAYHLVRLLLEVEMILVEHDLDIERSREVLKSIRRGEWTLERIDEWFTAKERSLEALYASSTLPHAPDEKAIRDLLMDCLEEHYGSLSGVVVRDVSLDKVLAEVQAVIDRYAS